MLYKTSHTQIIDGLMSNSLKKIPINWVLSFVRTTSVIHLMLRLTRKILYGLSRSKQMPKSFSSVRMALSSLPTLCFLVAEPLFSLWRNPVVIHRCHKQNSKMLKFLSFFSFPLNLLSSEAIWPISPVHPEPSIEHAYPGYFLLTAALRWPWIVEKPHDLTVCKWFSFRSPLNWRSPNNESAVTATPKPPDHTK